MNLRSAYRNWNEPDNRNDNLGFRLSPARRVVGMNPHDQAAIQSGSSMLPAKTEAGGALVALPQRSESPPFGRYYGVIV